MFDKLLYDFFFLNLKDYPNIGIDFEINVFLLCVFVAVAACFFIVNMYRQNIQDIVMQLTRHGAKDEESAKTLNELHLKDSAFIKMALSGEGQLAKVVGRVGETVYTYEEYVALSNSKTGVPKDKIDFKEARFYLRSGENAETRAQHIIDNYGTSTLRAILYAVFFLALYVCLALVMPEILTYVDDFLANLAA